MATLIPSEETIAAGSTSADEPAPASEARSSLRDPNVVVQRVVQGAHEAIDRVAAQAVPAVEHWVSAASQAGELINEKADRLGEIQEQWLTDARDTVRANPLASVLAAVAIGMLVARLTSR